MSPMSLTRRQLLLSATTTPLLAACATDLSRYRGESIPDLASRRGVCAVALATVKAGAAEPVRVIGGCADGASLPVAPVFQAASLTKPVMAFGALRLALAGQLDLQSAVSSFLPRGYVHYRSALARNPGDPGDVVPVSMLSRISVASLLNHTSGLPNWSSGALSIGFEPGERWQYSGEGYMLLQAVVEAVTGMGISAYADEHVFTPLGMRDSSLVWKDSYGSRAMRGTSSTGSPRGVRFKYPVAAASLYTTADDYAKFLSSLLSDERLLALCLSRPVSADRSLGLEWGYGWGIERTVAGPNLWHWGNNPGFRAFAMVSPSSKDGFVIFTNSDRGMALAVPLAYQVLPTEHNAFRFAMVG
jgi:CubicO group peptidase (beta-lactamase class C family)